MSIKTIKKYIQNDEPTPWLNWIIDGRKKYEGRLNKNDWTNLIVGDIIIFNDGKNRNCSIKTKVTCLKYYDNFEIAFRELGKELVPINDVTEHEVKELYNKYFSDSDIKKYGVIVVGIEYCGHIYNLDRGDIEMAANKYGFNTTSDGRVILPRNNINWNNHNNDRNYIKIPLDEEYCNNFKNYLNNLRFEKKN